MSVLRRAKTVPAKQNVTTKRVQGLTSRLIHRHRRTKRTNPVEQHRNRKATTTRITSDNKAEDNLNLYLDLNLLLALLFHYHYNNFNIFFNLEFNLKGIRTFRATPIKVKFSLNKQYLHRSILLRNINLQRQANDGSDVLHNTVVNYRHNEYRPNRDGDNHNRHDGRKAVLGVLRQVLDLRRPSCGGENAIINERAR